MYVHVCVCLQNQVAKVELRDKNDLICMAVQEEHDLVVVGSQYYVTFIDPRSACIVRQVESRDGNWGVRSVQFLRNKILSVGEREM